MVTYTVRHDIHDNLATLLKSFLGAHRRITTGSTYGKLKSGCKIFGAIRCLEVTYSKRNGWHPHAHVLVFCSAVDAGIDVQDLVSFNRWKKATQQQLDTTLWRLWQNNTALEKLTVDKQAFRIDATEGAIADYIAKWGHEPQDGKRAWGAEDEMTKAHSKKARNGGDNPFQLLAAILDGKEELKPRFVEYATWFKGKRQLQWSNGLKKRFEIEELNDAELAEKEIEENISTLAQMNIEEWKQVLAHDWKRKGTFRGELLNFAAVNDHAHIVEFLAREVGIHIDGDESNTSKPGISLAKADDIVVSAFKRKERLRKRYDHIKYTVHLLHKEALNAPTPEEAMAMVAMPDSKLADLRQAYKQADKEYRQLEAQYRDILDNPPVGVHFTVPALYNVIATVLPEEKAAEDVWEL
jgi:hypothetical protein